MRDLFLLQNIDIHDDWNDFFDESLNHSLQEIEEKIRPDMENQLITPSKEHILRFLALPLKKIKVIILGQDPYPQKGVATGRAFEVATLTSWTVPFRNVSLQNMVRALVKAQTGRIYKYSEIKAMLVDKIDLADPQDLFTYWEQQGVLLLNTAFTCRLDEPGSHTKYWESFTGPLLNYINEQIPDATWFLWGNHALKVIEEVQPVKQIFTYHPSRCNPRPKDFLYGDKNCFKETGHLIDWFGSSKKTHQLKLPLD